jgi:alpha-amylase
MPHLYLGLAIHNHQPVGNFDFVFEQVYRQSYLPLIEALERHPAIRLSLHYSGCLLDWLFVHKPEFVDRLAALADRSQVELMTGGYYEPILPMIPDADKRGQIAKLSSLLKDRFGQQPTGLWLTERVWEPALPSVLALEGIDWTVVDDMHFRLVGIDEQQLRGYFLTEDQGLALKLYGSSKQLRYIIPWRPVEEVIAYLREQADETAGSILVMGDDGEKFGSWPGTYEHCWERRWVEHFFAAIEANSDWLSIIPIGDHARRFAALGPVYLPSASYDEMMEWSLPVDSSVELERLRHEANAQGRDDLARYLQGGFWRNFLRKYPEINAMHKRMLRTHQKVQSLEPSQRTAAQDRLWSGQCNCAYWHGVFGGLYLNHIRAATQSNLIAAEAEADHAPNSGTPRVTWQQADHDFDGQEEILIQTPTLSLLVHPSQGGMLSEWDLRPQRWNLLNVVSRRREAYHESLLHEEGEGAVESQSETRTIHDVFRRKEANLQRYLAVDAYRRGGFQEHFLPMGTAVDDFASSRYNELGDFVSSEFQVEVEQDAEALKVLLARDGSVSNQVGGQTFRLRKRLTVSSMSQSLRIDYELTNLSSQEVRCLFVSEWNLNLPHYDATIRVGEGSDESIMSLSALSFAARLRIEGGAGVSLQAEASEPVRVWRFPIETVSNSEGGLERSNQGVCLAFVVELALQEGESRTWRLRWDESG